MAKPIPLALELVAFHPAIQCLAAPARHMVRAAVWTYWLGECREMPSANSDWVRVAETDLKAWARHGQAVKAAMAEIMPALAEARAESLLKLSVRKARASKAGIVSAATRRAAKVAQTVHAAPTQPPEPVFRVAHKPVYQGDGRTDVRERARAKARNEHVARNGMMDVGDTRGIVEIFPPATLPPPPPNTVAGVPWVFVPTETPPPGIVDAAD